MVLSSKKNKKLEKKLQENSNSNIIKGGNIYFINKIKRMSEKKKILIEVLKQLEGHRDLAQGFLVIIERTGDEKTINDLLKLIQKGIKTIKNKRIRSKLINRVKELQRKGDLEQEKNSEESDNMLDNFINNTEA